jgi:peptide chain release factor 2
LEKTKEELKSLEDEMSRPGFWDDQVKATQTSKTAEELRDELVVWDAITKEVVDALSLVEGVEQEDDDSLTGELESAIKRLEESFAKLEFKLLLDQPYDAHNATVAIHAGTGGVDAQDWSEMLLRMIVRYCEKRDWQVSTLHKSMGGEAGIKSAMIAVRGRYAFGYLKAEAGVHRLVRISPFDAEKMRHTSFALVEVIPDLSAVEADIEIKDSDLRIDVYRASGHGGQSVNTTDSAVRIVHLPTKITVTCQNERSQAQNKATAMSILKSKLLHQQAQQRQAVEQELRGEYQSAEWGNQIRSYVLQPYTMVKDHRTKHEVSDVERVLGGEIDGFIEAYLKEQVSQRKKK